MIDQEAIDENYRMAREEAPEVFAPAPSMLYIDTEINGVRVLAYATTGAQSTIMSAVCAERCGLTRLMDRRFHGKAVGNGTRKILGRIHMAQMKIGAHHFPCSFTILETSDVEFLFGLDMLKRHLCVMNLKEGILALGSAGATVPFLSEKGLPSSARETTQASLKKSPLPRAAPKTKNHSAAAASVSATTTPAPAAPTAPAMDDTETPAATAEAVAAVPPVAATAATVGGGTGGGVDEAQVTQLVGMGFPREQASGALSSTGGDAEQAVGLLLAQMNL